MKKKALLSILLASAMTVTLAAGCINNNNENSNNNENNNNGGEVPQPVRLSAPQITLSGNVISWNAVDNATGYDVYEGDTAVSTAQTALTYTINKTEAGEYNYTVKAVSTDEKYTTSAASNSVKYTVKADPNPPETDTSVKLTGKIYIVGDSTVCDYSLTSAGIDNAYLPRYGYGTQLYNYINCDESQIVNLALSGRSSLSYLTESNYNTLKDEISADDYLIIGFGHNDEKSDDAERFTNPKKTHTDSSTENGPSFQYTLYENYVKLAKEKGATPILCTPIVRYSSSGKYEGSVVHNTSAGDYAQAIKTLGEATDTTVIDLTTITAKLYSADNEKAKYYHVYSSYEGEKPTEKPVGLDATHINKYGAKKVCYELTKALLETECPLKANVITNSKSPTYENDYKDAIRADYEKPDYSAPVLGSSIGKTNTETAVEWYKSAFGSLGGDNKVENYKINYEAENGKFIVGNAGNTNGKFESKTDGFGAAFIRIDANKNFTASVKIKLTVSNTDAQSGFGMMIRDDMYINAGKIDLNSNYVAAGAYGTNAIFKREETKLSPSGMTAVISTDKEYSVSITRLGQKITATFSDGVNNFSEEYLDVKLNNVDEDYMYLCLFANRGLVAEFTEVQFKITGDSQGA